MKVCVADMLEYDLPSALLRSLAVSVFQDNLCNFSGHRSRFRTLHFQSIDYFVVENPQQPTISSCIHGYTMADTHGSI